MLIKKPRISNQIVMRAYADYASGLSMAATARKHGRNPHSLRELFQKRDLAIRVDPRGKSAKLPNGCVAPVRPLTWQEIDEVIAKATKLCVPTVLKQEWRNWSLVKRGVFVGRLRARLRSPKDRPETPFSANVVPFDYGSPEAWEIVRRLNAGRGSLHWAVKLDLTSQGVIYRGRLWFLCQKIGYQSGPWTPDGGRPSLHRTIWEEGNGRAVPAHHVVYFRDGNKNNLAPENLGLKHRGNLATENKDRGRANQRRTRQFFQMSAAAGAIAHAL